ncbi:unnamed protein product [Peniophora sp. CBMAI 1063]|nr:unnamed protein product [Peniophora sp. CBMAI 1063]
MRLKLIPLLLWLSGLSFQLQVASTATTTQRCSSVASSATATASFSGSGSSVATGSSSAASASSTHHSSSGNNSDDDDDDKSSPDSGDNARRNLDFIQCIETVESGGSGLSKGAVAGIVIGFLALAAALAALAYMYWRKRRAARRQAIMLASGQPSPKTKFLSALPSHTRETSHAHSWAPLLGGTAARRQDREAADADAASPTSDTDREFMSIPVFERELPPTPSGISARTTAPSASTSAALLAPGLGSVGGSTTTRRSALHSEMTAYQRDLKGDLRSGGSVGHSSIGHSVVPSTTDASGSSSGRTSALHNEMEVYQRDLKSGVAVQAGQNGLSAAPSASSAAVAIASGSGSASGGGGASRRSSLQSELTEHQVNLKAEARREREREEGPVEPPPEYSFD